MARYLVLDGNSLAYRAWFALKDAGMSTSSGQETQAVFGFVSMLTRLLEDFRPDGVAVAFDRPEPTFRDAIAADYKLGRPTTPEPLVAQFGLIRQFVTALGAPVLDAVGYEADDVIGTLARRLADEGDDVFIVSGDRDTYQLVRDPHVKVLYNLRGVTEYALYDEAGILAKTGVRPIDYPLLAALRGDPSDNLPGVPGVGEKTAARLVSDYGDIDGIFANLERCTPKLRESLAAHEDQVRLNFRLTPIACDVPVALDKAELRLERADREAIERLLDFLEMRTLKERLVKVLAGVWDAAAPAPDVTVPVAHPVTNLEGVPDALACIGRLAEGDGALAIEAFFAGTPGRSAIEGLALYGEGTEEVALLPGELLVEDEVRKALSGLFGADGGGRGVVAHRAKELMRALLGSGVDLRTLSLDTAVVAYLIDPSEGQQSLEEVASRRGIASTGGAEAAEGQLGFALDPEQDPFTATALRAETVALLSEALASELESAGGRRLWEEVERPLVRVLAKMEVAGIAVDLDELQRINAELTAETERLEGAVHAIAGEPFNLNSPPQLRVVLYEKLGLRPQRRTKTGFSTDAQTLERLRDEHPIVEALLSYREVEKLRSTYGSGLLAEVADDGRIHASFNQTVARTGRLSSDAPNLHNIPVRSDLGRQFRAAFVPGPGAQFVVADYNQIELRVIAHLSHDPGLVAAFEEGRDIHATTASGIYGVAPEAVTPAMRAKAKMVSYGLAYGMEAYGLSQRLGIPVEEASGILSSYFEAFPSVRAYMEGTVAEAKARGYTETECGRRRYLPELTSDNFRVRQAAERQAMNAGIQGLAADIFKIALVRLDEALEAAGLCSRIVLQVHDEILVESPLAEVPAVAELTEETMRGAYPLEVPLEVHVARGESWAAAKPI